ncbi:MAG: lysine--tRNA ligase, partial [Leptonema sp. (in: Bacteria)]|nr:lysine--tRNA ligase [Leptonema sp. (in: bacteria)]
MYRSYSVSQQHIDQFETRLEKLEKIQEKGYQPYLTSFDRKDTVEQVLSLEPTTYNDTVTFSIAGRIRAKRMMGKAGFLQIEDETGRMQFYVRRDDEGIDFDIIKLLDLGDIVGLTGFPFVTQTGEKTIHARSVVLLAKCLRPLPVVKEADGKVFDAFTNKEQRYRMRYVDLIVNPEVRQTFVMRSRIISYVRNFLLKQNYLEVETPMMQTIPGGATARPFVTHHNALNMQLYLRIAPELYLKRLLVGGFPKVFEINRNFRNEGISYKHNPEFTMLEVYQAYGSMSSMMDLCERLITGACLEVNGSLQIPYNDTTIDLTAPWKRLGYFESIKQYAKTVLDPSMSLEQAIEVATKAGHSVGLFKDASSVWNVADILFDEAVEPNLIQPVMITEYPKEISPLARSNPDDQRFVDRFEPYIAGREIGNAFSELNDPFDQKARFQEQVNQREAGNEEAGFMDLDYIRALEYGMPPAGGMGIGIDRLVMLLTNNHSIRDTIL